MKQYDVTLLFKMAPPGVRLQNFSILFSPAYSDSMKKRVTILQLAISKVTCKMVEFASNMLRLGEFRHLRPKKSCVLWLMV